MTMEEATVMVPALRARLAGLLEVAGYSPELTAAADRFGAADLDTPIIHYHRGLERHLLELIRTTIMRLREVQE